MKVGLVHKRFELRGGAERVLYRTAEGLRDRGHEIHLFCGQFLIPAPAGITPHTVPHIPFPRTARFLSFALMAPRTVDRYHCDVVMSFHRIARQNIFRSGGGPHRAYLEKMAARGGGMRRVYYSLSPYHRCVLAVERLQLSAEGCQKVITVSEEGRREMIEYYHLPEEKVQVIHNGVDHNRFNPRRRIERGKGIREGLGIAADQPVILFVGTGFRRKGLERLLRLWEDGSAQNMVLLIVGNDAKLASYRRRWNHREIHFVGPRSNVEDYYAAADLFVLPSVQEAFGNVVLEAMASGLPVVTIPGVGAVDEMEGELQEGILTDPNDPDELKTRMRRLLDPSRRHVLSALARKVAEKYNWQKYLDEVESSLYEVRSQLLSITAH